MLGEVLVWMVGYAIGMVVTAIAIGYGVHDGSGDEVHIHRVVIAITLWPLTVFALATLLLLAIGALLRGGK